MEIKLINVHLVGVCSRKSAAGSPPTTSWPGPSSCIGFEAMYDVVIVGGGPAGLSAALVLGRCRRSVLVCDTGRPRNYASHAMHGYLTRDGMPPSEFLTIARRELAQYDSVQLRHVEVTGAECQPGGHFKVTLATGESVQ